ncbi:beta-ketoacyl-[acyl-carrier-protein] synthase family protein [Shumkonia mesophila]|uniref:beta-ketoacyl-[acyl-carrier-protein] synthase family protein n=1 Tax=Shumkonia mesophila TaxID=2838854 RepID=UPI0029346460|nr:beta-ketoacyl-[acyl-carrier-protein] synthase family protein [Shumkonia mesophila]
MSPPLYLNAVGIGASLGLGKQEVAPLLFAGSRETLRPGKEVRPGRAAVVGAIERPLPALPPAFSRFDSRNNRLLAALLSEIRADIEAAARRYGRDRIAIVLGTSTSGMAEGEAALAAYRETGRWPADFDYRQQEVGSAASFAARWLETEGPAYVVATACSSGAKTFASARRLIAAGLCDAAVVGGVDTLCRLTLAGFSALESVSAGRCNPFSANRDGITIGEGGAVFLMTREPSEIALLGIGETSDAHHISAPDPEGKGALDAMRAALADAGLSRDDIRYVNLHGTATPLNDIMESKAVCALFGETTPCSSTKAMTGHTLGAAGAIEAAFLWLTLHPRFNPGRRLPPHLWDGAADTALAPIRLATTDDRLPDAPRVAALSNSFGFGGSNCGLVLGRGW